MYYRESRRRRVGGRGRILRVRGRYWAVLLGAVVVIAVVFWLLR